MKFPATLIVLAVVCVLGLYIVHPAPDKPPLPAPWQQSQKIHRRAYYERLEQQCKHLDIDLTRSYTQAQLNDATLAYAKCLGVEILDECNLSERDRDVLERQGGARIRPCRR